MLKYKVKIYKDIDEFLESNSHLKSISTVVYPSKLNCSNEEITLCSYEFENLYKISDESETIYSLNEINVNVNYNTIINETNLESKLIKKIMKKYAVNINEDNCLWIICRKEIASDMQKLFVECILAICSLFNN